MIKVYLISLTILISLSNSFTQVIDPYEPGNQSRWWYQYSGYLNKDSFILGDTIKFYISNNDTNLTFYNINIFRDDTEYLEYPNSTGVPVYTSPNLPVDYQGIPLPADSAYKNGPGWSESFRYVIPSDWEPGMYRAQFIVNNMAADPESKWCNIEFVVRPVVPGSFSDILFVVPYNNFQAYNNWGGKSLYPFNSTSNIRAYKVSFNRPINQFFTREYVKWVEPIRSWLYQQGSQYIPEFADQKDIDAIPNLFSNYKLVLFVAHDEYWTRNELNALKNYVNNGGTAAIFAGNVCWWQVRYENNGGTMVCYKSESSGVTADPLFGVVDSLVTVNFFDNPVYYPENQATGLSYRKGGYVQQGSILPHSAGWGGYNDLYNTQSWVYRGTGLTYGDTLGKRGPTEEGIVGYEVDGCDFTGYTPGNPTAPVVTGTDGTPLTFKILGTSVADVSPHQDGRHAVMGMYRTKGGGWVFNAASIYWAKGLQTSYYGEFVPEVRTITKSVIDKFLRLSRMP